MIAAFTARSSLALPRRGRRAGLGGWGGEEVQQGGLGDADGAADADRADLAAGNSLVELVAADPEDRGDLLHREHLGEPGKRVAQVGLRASTRFLGWCGRGLGLRPIDRVTGWPSLHLPASCSSRCGPACPTAGCGGGGTIPRFRTRVWRVLPASSPHRDSPAGLASTG